MFEKKLILDTCALIWLAQGEVLSKKTLLAVEKASAVFVSAISGWEISLKAAKKQISLPIEAEEWFTKILKTNNLQLAALDSEILFAANRLEFFHKDPADRIIIATAIRENAAVVTSDKVFSKYPVRTLI